MLVRILNTLAVDDSLIKRLEVFTDEKTKSKIIQVDFGDRLVELPYTSQRQFTSLVNKINDAKSKPSKGIGEF